MSYLTDFLFTPQRARTPVKALSGGECNRLLLARLFSKPANLLVMDEPTNDLDIETLELLEDLLSHYHGTLLLVSHDRAFLDNVVTSTLVFEGDGIIKEYIGGYKDWMQQRQSNQPVSVSQVKATTSKSITEQPRQIKKLSYKDQKELDGLPKMIEDLESEQIELQDLVSTSEFYKQDQELISRTLSRLKTIETDLEKAYARWDELETLVKLFKQE